MGYKLFLTKSIDTLKDEVLIGEADSYQEICSILKKNIKQAEENKYWRILFGEMATFIDYGSWSLFAAIVPPVTIQEIEGVS